MKLFCLLGVLTLSILVGTSTGQSKKSGGVILVKISSVLNPDGRDAAGSCCSDGPLTKEGGCPGPCYSMLRVCATNVKNDSLFVVQNSGRKPEKNIERSSNRHQNIGVQAQNPNKGHQNNFIEYSTRPGSQEVVSRPKQHPNNQVKENFRVIPHKDFKSNVKLAPNLLQPSKNVVRRPYINSPKSRPSKRKVRPPVKPYANFGVTLSEPQQKQYSPNAMKFTNQKRPFRNNQPLPQSRTGLPFFETTKRKENHVWETNEYTVMWREERALLKPDTECKFGSLTTEVIFNNSLQNQGDLLVKLPFSEGYSGVFELTIEVWHVNNPKKIPQLKMQSKKVEEKSIFASILETITTQLTKTVNDIELKKSKSENKKKETEKVNVNETDKVENTTITLNLTETSTLVPDLTTIQVTDSNSSTDSETKTETESKDSEIVETTTAKEDFMNEIDTDSQDEQDSGNWKVMTNKAKMILRVEKDLMVYAGQNWQSDQFTSYHSSIQYSVKLVCAKNYTGPTCSFAKICLNKNLRLFNRLTCTEDGQIICRPGWTGSLCDQPICAPGCHPKNGYCNAPGECKCRAGYYGDKCESCVKLLGCSSHGYCTKSFECLCEEGYKGIFCSEPVCAKGCNLANGFCSVPGECKCKSGWTGVNCTECVRKPGCQNGTCSKPFECKCDDGYRGALCDKPKCSSGCHETNGYCQKPGDCFCKVGFHGKRCDECLPYPGCLNGGCERPWDCQCLDGWKGLKCDEMETDLFGDGVRLGRCLPLGSFRCMNGGIDICTWFGNGTIAEEPRCQCKGGFTGKYCQNSINGDKYGVYKNLLIQEDKNAIDFSFPTKLGNSLEKL